MTQTATRGPTTYPAAELDRRFYAFTVDRLIAWGLYGGAGLVAYRYFFDQDRTGAGIALVAGVVVVVGLASALLLGVAGVSPGKVLAGVRVVHHETGSPIGVGPALVRTVVLGIAALPTFCLGVATLAWTAVVEPGGRRRGWHDQVSKAVVVDVRPVPVDEVVEESRPRQIVNLTAMRLMPSPAEPVAHPAPAPARPAPAGQSTHSTQSTPAPVASPVSPPPPTAPPPSPPPSAPPPPAPPAPPPARPAPEAPPVLATRVAAPAPAAGLRWRVAFDTGETFVVEGLALVGRRPEPRPGEPVEHLVPLRSTDMSLSKTHAQFQVVPDGTLVVMDRGSTNGSVLVRQGVAKPLSPGRPSTLVEGDTVRFGDREMTVRREA